MIQQTIQSVYRAQLERAAEHYLQACFRERTAVRSSEFALELGITPPYLSRLAQGILQEPIRDFLRRKQLERAARLLGVTPLPIEEIALSSGFGTAKTFYRVFRKAFGMTPDAYRRLRNDSGRSDTRQAVCASIRPE